MLAITPPNYAECYYLHPAVAYVRGILRESPVSSPAATLRYGQQTGLDLSAFKRSRMLPRVQRVLGFLKGIGPESLLDVGTGRGVFLLPLLDQFPDLPITCIDLKETTIKRWKAVSQGGYNNLSARVMDIRKAAFPARSFDVVTLLEVLEHIKQPEIALRQAMRMAKRWVILSVPSREDDNPEHIHLFTYTSLCQMVYEQSRALGLVERAPKFDWVNGHMLAYVQIGAFNSNLQPLSNL